MNTTNYVSASRYGGLGACCRIYPGDADLLLDLGACCASCGGGLGAVDQGPLDVSQPYSVPWSRPAASPSTTGGRGIPIALGIAGAAAAVGLFFILRRRKRKH